MKLKESITIQGLIRDRRKSLSRDDLSEAELDRRAKALNILIDARDALDALESAGQIQTESPVERILARQRRGYRKRQGLVPA